MPSSKCLFNIVLFLGTMTIMIALVTRAAWMNSNGDLHIFYLTIASVLSGSIFGDHGELDIYFYIPKAHFLFYLILVSPISDTTLLTSYACRCSLMGHVNTQAPYASGKFVISQMYCYFIS